jgi:hypothetical protein
MHFPIRDFVSDSHRGLSAVLLLLENAGSEVENLWLWIVDREIRNGMVLSSDEKGRKRRRGDFIVESD